MAGQVTEFPAPKFCARLAPPSELVGGELSLSSAKNMRLPWLSTQSMTVKAGRGRPAPPNRSRARHD